MLSAGIENKKSERVAFYKMQFSLELFSLFPQIYINILKCLYSVSVGHVISSLGFSCTEENECKYVFTITRLHWELTSSSLSRPKCQIRRYSKINNNLKHIGKKINQRRLNSLTILHNSPDEAFSSEVLQDVPARTQRGYQRTDHSTLPLVLPPFSCLCTARHCFTQVTGLIKYSLNQ